MIKKGVDIMTDKTNMTAVIEEIKSADEDELNPFPDGLKPDDDDQVNSTWMMSGRNRKI